MSETHTANAPPVMAEYELKPKVVKAVQWHRPGDHPDVVGEGHYTYLRNEEGGVVEHVQPGDWIVEHRPFAADVVDDEEFRETYQARRSATSSPIRGDRWRLGRAAYEAAVAHRRGPYPNLKDGLPSWDDMGDLDREPYCQMAEAVMGEASVLTGDKHDGIASDPAGGPEDISDLTPCTIDRVGGVIDDDVGAEADGVAITIGVHGRAGSGRGVVAMPVSSAAKLASEIAATVSEMLARRNP